MATTTRTIEQFAYLNAVHQAATNMRNAAKSLARSANQVADFAADSPYRPDIYAQHLVQAPERIAALNTLLDLSGAMRVTDEDLAAALSEQAPYFSPTESG